MVAAELVVRNGLKVPQTAAGRQVQDTPALVESLATVAVTEAVFVTSKEDGGVDKETEIGVTGLTELLLQAERVEKAKANSEKVKIARLIRHLS